MLAQRTKPGERKKVFFRAHDWINLKTSQPVKSVQARFVGERKWMNVCTAGKPLFFRTERQRQRALVSLEERERSRRTSLTAQSN